MFKKIIGGSEMNWLFTDMNSYFASAEQMLQPELRGRPVGIVPLFSEGTCIIAASHQAKRTGIKVGTPVPEARRLCPGIRLVKARPDEYVRIHRNILRSVDRCAPIERVYSIDEWSIRLRGEERNIETAVALGMRIKQQLLQDFGPCLTCSIGIAPTRLLAKIGSDLQKPDGLTVLPVSELPQRLEHLALRDLCGIGRGVETRLNHHGIRTVSELWAISRAQANRIWGSVSGGAWWAGLHGYDEPETPTRCRSMTHGHVLGPRFRNDEGACLILVRLVCKLGERLRERGYCARRLQLSLRDVDGNPFHDALSLSSVQDTTTLLQQFYRLWERRSRQLGPIKKVDVTVADLVPEQQVPESLFGDLNKLRRLSHAVDSINRNCGAMSIYFAPVHQFRDDMENKIAFGRIPDGCGD